MRDDDGYLAGGRVVRLIGNLVLGRRSVVRFVCPVAACVAAFAGWTSLPAATLTVQTNHLGSTPEILAYNSGHFYPGSNTRDWWRYPGVNGARVFMTPSEIEASDDIAGTGDGVNSQASFLERRAAIRTNQFNAAQARLAQLRKGASAADRAAGQARVGRAQAQLDLLTTVNPADLSAAEAELRRAQAQLDLLAAGARPEAIPAAEAEVTSARATLDQARSRRLRANPAMSA